MQNKSNIEIFQSDKGLASINVLFEKETVWLSEEQLINLFGKARRTIGEHIQNIYSEGELEVDSTWREIRQVRIEGERKVNRTVSLYNLDVIISVGYRIKSKTGTQFRIWATNILKQHLVKGYSINEKRLKELKQTIQLLQKTSESKELTSDEAKGLFKVLSDYSFALDILDDYDHQRLEIKATQSEIKFIISYDEAINAIQQLKDKFGGSSLFGNEKDDSFKSSIATINQTFDGEELYPSIEEKAANLLYFVVKNHSFTDGNKRIAAWLFVWYLERNNILYSDLGEKRIADNALVALTLMIAESNPTEKEMMTKVIVNLINRNN